MDLAAAGAAAAPRQRVQQILARYGGGGNLWARTRLRLLDAFRIFDKDGDGAVSMQEMIHCLRSLGLGFSEEDIAALAAVVDADSDGSIDYTEFVSYFKPARRNNSVAPSCNDSTAILASPPPHAPAREPPAWDGTDTVDRATLDQQKAETDAVLAAHTLSLETALASLERQRAAQAAEADGRLRQLEAGLAAAKQATTSGPAVRALVDEQIGHRLRHNHMGPSVGSECFD